MYFIASKKLRTLIKNSEKTSLDFFDSYQFQYNEQNVNLYISHKRARKSVHIHCSESGDVIWEQFYPFGGMSRPAREKKYALKPLCDKNAISVVIIRGTPGNITGLDNGIFKSHLATPEKNTVYLMTENNSMQFLESI